MTPSRLQIPTVSLQPDNSNSQVEMKPSDALCVQTAANSQAESFTNTPAPVLSLPLDNVALAESSTSQPCYSEGPTVQTRRKQFKDGKKINFFQSVRKSRSPHDRFDQESPPPSPEFKDVATKTKQINVVEKKKRVFSGLRSPEFARKVTDPMKKIFRYEALLETVKHFCVFTSLDGIAHIILCHRRNPCKWKNKVYLLAFLLFVGFDMYYMVEMLRRYFEAKDFDVKALRRNHHNVDFPGVTICNMNKIKAGHDSPFYPPTRESSSGHILKEMLIKCSFAGKACNTTDFHWFWSNERGNCYTFNNHKDATGHEIPSKKLFFPGKKSNLLMVIDVNHDLYPHHIERFGMMVIVHDRTTKPDFSQRRELSPGYWYTAMMKMDKHKLYDGAGRCTKITEKLNRERSFYAAKYDYTRPSCQSTCVQVQAMREFKCCIKSYPCNPLRMKTMFGEKLDPSVKPCTTAVPNKMTKAQFTKWSEIKRHNCQKHCKQACDHTEFTTLYSTFAWPRKGSVDYEFHMQRQRTTHNCCENDIKTLEHLKDNTLGLDLFFPTFDVTVNIEEPKYKFASILAGIGAMLGACVGFSLITALEVSDFLIRKLLNLFQ